MRYLKLLLKTILFLIGLYFGIYLVSAILGSIFLSFFQWSFTVQPTIDIYNEFIEVNTYLISDLFILRALILVLFFIANLITYGWYLGTKD